jgi:hypothetical protein
VEIIKHDSGNLIKERGCPSFIAQADAAVAMVTCRAKDKRIVIEDNEICLTMLEGGEEAPKSMICL